MLQGTMGHPLHPLKDCIPDDSVSGWPSDKRKGNLVNQVFPSPPFVKFVRDLGSGQPHKLGIGKSLLQMPNRLACQICSEIALEIRDNKSGILDQITTPLGPRFRIGQLAAGFERVSRSHQPPDRI